MHLFHLCCELRRKPGEKADPIILVVAEDAQMARKSLSEALVSGAIPFQFVAVERWKAADLGPHDGPEPSGAVFVDGVAAPFCYVSVERGR
jgi:hypothetical protein